MIENFEIGDLVKVKDYASYSLKDKFVGMIVKIDNEDYIGQELFIYNFEYNQIWKFDSCFAKIEKL
jgi:hypothetical protein